MAKASPQGFVPARVGSHGGYESFADGLRLRESVSRVDMDPPSDRGRADGPILTRTAADWDDLLTRLKTRLAEALPSISMTTNEAHTAALAHPGRGTVLECFEALEAMHSAVIEDLDRTRRLEAEVSETRELLTRTLEELAGTKAGERRARHLALHDSLTALPNRRHFRANLAEAIARATPGAASLAVLYLDLDEFKPINDTHGHHIGDKLLRIVAARLARTLRSGDMVSRLGGDEFACLIDGSPDREQLVHLARKLYEAVSAPVTIGSLELTVRPSIGIAMCPADGATAEALLESADAAMYRAKRSRTGHALSAPPTDG